MWTFLEPDSRGGCVLQFIVLVGLIIGFVLVADAIFASFWGAR